MTARNALMHKLPPPVEEALKSLAANLKKARLRRNLSVQTIADRIGVSRRLVTDAERGKPSTGVAVYVAMLWAMDLEGELRAVANPNTDGVGRVGALAGERTRAGWSIDADFRPPHRRS